MPRFAAYGPGALPSATTPPAGSPAWVVKWKKARKRATSAAPTVATGRYIGDGTFGRLIVTGLSGNLKAVTSYSSPATGAGSGVQFTSDSLSPGDFRDASGNLGLGFTLSGPNFTVSKMGGGPLFVNENGFAYDWIAWSG